MQFLIEIKDFIAKNLLGGKGWKVRVISTIAVIIFTMVAVKISLPLIWLVWAWTWQFWISLITLYLATIAFASGKGLHGIIYITIAIAVTWIYLANTPDNKWNYYQKQIDESHKDDPWNLPMTDSAQMAKKDTLKNDEIVYDEIKDIDPSITDMFSSAYCYDFDNLGPNAELIIVGTNINGSTLKQKISTDNDGIRNDTYSVGLSDEYLPSESIGEDGTTFKPMPAVVKITHTKGSSKPRFLKWTKR